MPLVNMKDMLNHAYRNGYAVGAFDVGSLELIGAVVDAAETNRSPVILSLAESGGDDGDFELSMAAAEHAAQRAAVPVAIHVHCASTLEAATRAIRHGCNGVTTAASNDDFSSNVAHTREIVALAHACGVPVEGELGQNPAASNDPAQASDIATACTSVKEAEAFVSRTGVNFLAVAIGNGCARLRGKPKLDFDRLKKINEAVRMPLAIHAESGLSDDQFRKLIGQGVAKIYFRTLLDDEEFRRRLRSVLRAEVERCMILWGSAGRAAEVLAQCEPWRPVHHVIVYSASGTTDAAIHAIMAQGRNMLSLIPGVRRVIAGTALQENAKYRFTWLIEFAHPCVIDSYRDHPLHVEFADRYFHPVASDRITIDYQETDGAADPWLGNAATTRAARILGESEHSGERKGPVEILNSGSSARFGKLREVHGEPNVWLQR